MGGGVGTCSLFASFLASVASPPLHTHTHILLHSFTPSLFHSLTHSLTHIHTHTYTHVHTHTYIHTRTHTHTHTHTIAAIVEWWTGDTRVTHSICACVACRSSCNRPKPRSRNLGLSLLRLGSKRLLLRAVAITRGRTRLTSTAASATSTFHRSITRWGASLSLTLIRTNKMPLCTACPTTCARHTHLQTLNLVRFPLAADCGVSGNICMARNTGRCYRNMASSMSA